MLVMFTATKLLVFSALISITYSSDQANTSSAWPPTPNAAYTTGAANSTPSPLPNSTSTSNLNAVSTPSVVSSPASFPASSRPASFPASSSPASTNAATDLDPSDTSSAPSVTASGKTSNSASYNTTSIQSDTAIIMMMASTGPYTTPDSATLTQPPTSSTPPVGSTSTTTTFNTGTSLIRPSSSSPPFSTSSSASQTAALPLPTPSVSTTAIGTTSLPTVIVGSTASEQSTGKSSRMVSPSSSSTAIGTTSLPTVIVGSTASEQSTGKSSHMVSPSSSSISTEKRNQVIVPIVSALAVVSVIFAVFIIILCFYICCRSYIHSHKKSVEERNEMYTNRYSMEIFQIERCKKPTVSLEELFSHIPPMQAIPLESFADCVEELHEYDDELAENEYSEVKELDPPAPVTVALLGFNEVRNRYINVLPSDDTRVELKMIPSVPGSDYINANFIKGFSNRYEYIATQGPLPDTIADFWRMVWEYDAYIIVMVTNPIEKGTVKTEVYWPPQKGIQKTYGNIVVTLKQEVQLYHFTIRKLIIRPTATGRGCFHDPREVTQYHFTSWPDFGVPEDVKEMLKFVRAVRADSDNHVDDAPIVVHCSAGIGRTGTFIAIDVMLQKAAMKVPLDIKTFVCQMRAQRNKMVQTPAQYAFIYDVLNYALKYGDTAIPINRLIQRDYLDQLFEMNIVTQVKIGIQSDSAEDVAVDGGSSTAETESEAKIASENAEAKKVETSNAVEARESVAETEEASSSGKTDISVDTRNTDTAVETRTAVETEEAASSSGKTDDSMDTRNAEETNTAVKTAVETEDAASSSGKTDDSMDTTNAEETNTVVEMRTTVETEEAASSSGKTDDSMDTRNAEETNTAVETKETHETKTALETEENEIAAEKRNVEDIDHPVQMGNAVERDNSVEAGNSEGKGNEGEASRNAMEESTETGNPVELSKAGHKAEETSDLENPGNAEKEATDAGNVSRAEATSSSTAEDDIETSELDTAALLANENKVASSNNGVVRSVAFDEHPKRSSYVADDERDSVDEESDGRDMDGKEKSRVDREFEALLMYPGPTERDFTVARRSWNIGRNRSKIDLPLNSNRVVPERMGALPEDDYINASFVCGYFKDDVFVVADQPLACTLTIFWRMVLERNVTTLVMIGPLIEEDKYWFEGRANFDDITLELKETIDSGRGVVTRAIDVDSEEMVASQAVKLFHLEDWPVDCNTPQSPAKLLHLLALSQEHSSREKGAILVHNSSSLKQSATGVYCALMILQKQLETEQCADVFSTVLSLREQRPGILTTKGHYKFIYEVLTSIASSLATGAA